MRLLIAIAGPSESGKSFTTSYLRDHQGVVKLKLVDVLRDVYRAHVDPSLDGFDGWPFVVERDRPDWLAGHLRAWFGEHVPAGAVATIESLYGMRMVGILQQAADRAFEVWYLDAPEEVRVARQQSRANLSSRVAAEELLRRRDRQKREAGLDDVRGQSTVIDNSGSLQDLQRALERRLQASLSG